MGNRRVVAVHQPNFFPWLGYFNKIARADEFIFLDDCPVQKTGSTWTNRVRLLIGGKPRWITAPIVRAHGTQLIRDVVFDERHDWRKKLLTALETDYRKAPCYKETMDFLEPLILNRQSRLAAYNILAVTTLAEWLGIDVRKLVTASAVGVEAAGTERLIRLTRAVSGTAYLCGGGADGYQEDKMFADTGLCVEYQHFDHPTYPQRRDISFAPGLSVIDALMNIGQNETAQLV